MPAFFEVKPKPSISANTDVIKKSLNLAFDIFKTIAKLSVAIGPYLAYVALPCGLSSIGLQMIVVYHDGKIPEPIKQFCLLMLILMAVATLLLAIASSVSPIANFTISAFCLSVPLMVEVFNTITASIRYLRHKPLTEEDIAPLKMQLKNALTHTPNNTKYIDSLLSQYAKVHLPHAIQRDRHITNIWHAFSAVVLVSASMASSLLALSLVAGNPSLAIIFLILNISFNALGLVRNTLGKIRSDKRALTDASEKTAILAELNESPSYQP